MSATVRITDPRGREWTVRRMLGGWQPVIRPVAIAGARFGGGGDRVAPREDYRRRRDRRRERRERRRGAGETILAGVGTVLLLPFLLVAAWIVEFVYGLGLLLRFLLWLCCMPLYLAERLLLLITIPLFQAARHLGWARWPVEIAHVASRDTRGRRFRGRFDRERFVLRTHADVELFFQTVVPGLAEGYGLPAGAVRARLSERFASR
ncbi:hypothetical protein FHR81_005246 [Actinoalloteichus hoggarensis]|uniref:Uncharacterized protein n=1 Tax=Actinoalloteichus hoggarensis TaxID=1470176 RepID=A0A221W9J6_9PSEU|nr:hypothetical protein [Actinoalloteichus hoggarensis]ASO22688.1 hypothetical protein AHOG_25415 [Actinoalloteichus hoggarensis]MBB5924169.1 hypothetical protein [Actinoalloteichus hoggarensis]